MKLDYKDRIQAKAEEYAWERYDKDFYDLSETLRDTLYTEANAFVVEHW